MVAKDIDEYLAAVPAQERGGFEELRRTIKSVAPNAEKRIIYGIPGFMYHGSLVFFAAFKTRPGSYSGNKQILGRFKDEL